MQLYVMRDQNYTNGLNNLLRDYLLGKKNLIGAEVGSFAGQSASIFINSNCFNKFYCIDAWKIGYDNSDPTSNQAIEAQKIFDQKFNNQKRIIKIKKLSSEACKDFQDEFLDFIYIDASHKYEDVLSDLINFFPKVKKNGIIAGHDWNSCWPGVIKALKQYFNKEPLKIYQDTSWVYIK